MSVYDVSLCDVSLKDVSFYDVVLNAFGRNITHRKAVAYGLRLPKQRILKVRTKFFKVFVLNDVRTSASLYKTPLYNDVMVFVPLNQGTSLVIRYKSERGQGR